MAFVLAAVFLVHPVQTEAVACVSGISNLAVAFFILMSLYGYVRSIQAIGSSRVFWMAAAVFIFIVALFTKEQAAVLPVMCLIYELIFKERQKIAAILARFAIMFLPLLGYLILRHSLFGGIASAIFENTGELKLRLLSLAGLIEMYMRILLFPADLHYYRSINILAPYAVAWILLGVIAALLYLSIRPLALKDKKLAFFGLAWFIAALGPVLNIIPLVNEYSFIAAAEHNLYFPMIGFFIAACTIVNHYAAALSSPVKFLAKTILIVGIILMCILTSAQNCYWQGETALFQRALKFEPQLGRVHILLAKAYFNKGQMDRAIEEFSLARDIMISYVGKSATPKAKGFYQGMLKGIYSDSAQAFAAKGDWKNSIRQYDLALEIDPQDSYIYTNRALSLIVNKDIPGGIADLRKALALKPDNLLAANNLSVCFIQQGNIPQAQALLEAILRKDSGFKAARDNLERLNKSQEKKPLTF